MDRSRFTTLASLFTALLLAGTVVVSGCSDSLTGTTPPDQEVTVKQKASHNQTANTGDGGNSTDPGAGHNTTDED